MSKRHLLWRSVVAAILLVPPADAQRGRAREPAATEPAAQQEPTEFTPIQIGKNGFVIPAGAVPLRHLIERAAEYLQRNILYSDMELMQVGESTLQFQQPLALDALGCEETLSQLLFLRGLVLRAIDEDRGLYEVVHSQGQRARVVLAQAPRRTPEQILARPRLKVPVRTEVTLEHINAAIATNALRPFFAQSGQNFLGTLTFGTAGTNSSLIIMGLQDEVADVLLTLRTVDVAGTDAPGVLEPRIQAIEQRLADLAAAVAALTARLEEAHK